MGSDQIIPTHLQKYIAFVSVEMKAGGENRAYWSIGDDKQSANKTTKRKGLVRLCKAHIQFANPRFEFARLFEPSIQVRKNF
jgi:hypothetical protein